MLLVSSRFWQEVDDYLTYKDLAINGNEIVPTVEILDLLPLEKGFIWWHLNKSEIEKALLSNSLIESALFERCSPVPRCFLISVVERVPFFILADEQRQQVWIAGKDGAFIDPANHSRLRPRHIEDAIIVKGFIGQEKSMDILRRRLRLLGDVLSVISGVTKLSVKEALIRDDGDLKIIFEELKFPAIFGYHDVPSKDLVKNAEQESLRLNAILDEFSHRQDQIKEIDLAFDRLAAVKFND